MTEGLRIRHVNGEASVRGHDNLTPGNSWAARYDTGNDRSAQSQQSGNKEVPRQDVQAMTSARYDTWLTGGATQHTV